MSAAVRAMSLVQAAEIFGIAVVVVGLWRQHRDVTHAWLAAAFATLGAVAVAGQLLPTHPHGELQGAVVRILIAAIVLFPYLLYRFALTFHRARRRWLLVVNTAGSAVLCVWTFALPSVPAAGDPRSRGFTGFVVAVLLQWTSLSVLVAFRLWTAARHEPTVARRRMRTLALAAVGLDVSLLISGTTDSAPASPAQVVTGVIVLFIVPLFYVGLAPPNLVLTQWRTRDQQRMREATIGLLRASTAGEICDGLLPRATNFLGGHGSAIIDINGDVVGSYMLDEPSLRRLSAIAARRESSDSWELDDGVLWLPMSNGWLVMSTTSFTPFFGQDEAQVLMSIGTLTDLALSRVTLLERDRQHVESMRDFVAIASHDLRTPTASITGYASLLQRRWDILSEGDKLQAVDAMNRQSNHLHRLVEDLLTTSRIGASAIPVRPTTVNVADCLTDVVDDLQIAGVEIVASPDLFVVMDRDHLRRAITNYLRNAEVYGAPPLKIVAGREGNEITIKVVDHGNGVPEGFRPRLFEKFARADSKMSSAVGGTGLGLSIVTGLLEAAGGTAWYAPNVPRGSVFGITLPVPVAIPQQETREPQWTSAESS